MKIVLYHNPRCSKSRQARALLEDAGADLEIVGYLEAPPSVAELSGILDRLGVEPRDLLRTGEKEYRELGLADPALGREALLAAMVRHPRLIQRPIAVRGERAVVGRPPEAVLELLGETDGD
ncbi:MAG: arsenate reductase (glutaredoxin) [Thermoanaerobaculia bacterium]|nr:arsenate reductase (glutaredoxin) [Thermoanaerobaculia bacterium]